MTSVQKAVIPGILAGVLFMLFFISLLAAPYRVEAKNSGLSAQSQSNLGIHQNSPARTTSQNQSSICSLSQKFPNSILQWCGLIDQYAHQNGLDANLVASVMLQESGGDPGAYSRSGAVGLLQVMPRDGLSTNFQCINGPCFASRPTMQELSDPEFNISYGTGMLAGLIQKMGDVREALKAYGPIDMGYQYADIVMAIYQRYAQ